MPQEPWEVPVSEEGREALIALADQYRAAGQNRELGIVLTRLARMMKWVGTGRENVNWHDAAVSTATQAVEVLRATDDKLHLAYALRVAAANFVPDRQSLLREALALSIEVGNVVGEGWSYFALAKMPDEDSPANLDKAAKCFAQANSAEGLAHVDLTAGIHAGDRSRILQAAGSFEAQGKEQTAEEAYIMADTFGPKGRTFREREALVLKALQLAQKRGAVDRQKMYLERLARIMRKARQADAAKAYFERAAALVE